MSPHAQSACPKSAVRTARLGLPSCLALAVALWSPLAPASAPLANIASADSDIVTPIADVDVLALSDELKTVLNKRIKRIRNSEKRAHALHQLLFGADGYGIGYTENDTLTASQTLENGAGNCVSLANLFVAAARYVGLKAYFQEAKVEDWQDREDSGYYVLAGHINVRIKLSGRRQMTVEFLGANVGRVAHTRLMNDNEALAHYYNNLGMDELHKNNLPLAQGYLAKALAISDSSPVMWSNLGIVQKRLGDLQAAEDAYLTALERDDSHPSAAKNLYILYMQTGRQIEAEPYAALVEQHNRRNPYYLNKLAGEALDQGRYEEAIGLLKRALDIKQNEDRFHFSLAQAYYLSGDVERASQAMQKAREAADDPAEQQRYGNKLAQLNRLRSSAI